MRPPIFCFVCLWLFSYSVAGQDKWDLQQCVTYAVTHNLSVKDADLQARFSQLQLRQDKLSKIPTFSLQGNVGYQLGRSENPTTGVLQDNNFFNTGLQVSSNVTLFNWFALKHTVASSKLAYEADQAQVRKVQDDIALNVAVAYLQALLAKEQVSVNAIQVQQTESQLDLTRKQVRAGVLPELNELQLEAQLANDSSLLVTAEATVRQYLLQLKALLNLDAAAPFDIAAPPIETIPVENLADLQPDYVYSMGVANLTQQKVARLRLQSSQYGVKAARSNMMPRFSGYAGAFTNYVNIKQPELAAGPKAPTGATVVVDGTEYNILAPTFNVIRQTTTPFFTQWWNNFGQNIGIGLTVPIFNGGVQRTAWERSKLNMKQWELRIEQDNQKLKQDIYNAYNDAVAALQKFTANRKSVEAAEKAYNFAQRRYTVNLLSTYELINTQNNLLVARTQMLAAQFDYVFKMKLLEFYKGQGLKL